MIAIEQPAAAILALLTGVALGAWLQRGRTYAPAVERRLTTMAAQLNSWQRTHDFHQNELDQRLERVEQAAARTENETRMLSGLLSSQADKATRRRTAHPRGELTHLPPKGSPA